MTDGHKEDGKFRPHTKYAKASYDLLRSRVKKVSTDFVPSGKEQQKAYVDLLKKSSKQKDGGVVLGENEPLVIIPSTQTGKGFSPKTTEELGKMKQEAEEFRMRRAESASREIDVLRDIAKKEDYSKLKFSANYRMIMKRHGVKPKDLNDYYVKTHRIAEKHELEELTRGGIGSDYQVGVQKEARQFESDRDALRELAEKSGAFEVDSRGRRISKISSSLRPMTSDEQNRYIIAVYKNLMERGRRRSLSDDAPIFAKDIKSPYQFVGGVRMLTPEGIAKKTMPKNFLTKDEIERKRAVSADEAIINLKVRQGVIKLKKVSAHELAEFMHPE